MKKYLSMILASSMVLQTLSISLATETQGEEEDVLTSMEQTTNGVSGSIPLTPIDTDLVIKKEEGSSVPMTPIDPDLVIMKEESSSTPMTPIDPSLLITPEEPSFPEDDVFSAEGMLPSDMEMPNDNVATISDFGTVSGECGDNLTWTLVESTGALTISGSGAMDDYSQLSSYASKAPWFSYRSSITSVAIGGSVTSIGDYAFYYCSSLTSVTIPSSVTSIGGSAFYYCSSLPIVNIPSSVTSIGSGAFCYCSSLPSVTIPDSVTSIGNSTFGYCSNLTSVTIPSSVTSIGSLAFAECSSLASVTIPSSVISIGWCAFVYCSSLSYVYYAGTQAEWYELHQFTGNDDLIGSTVWCIDGVIDGTSIGPDGTTDWLSVDWAVGGRIQFDKETGMITGCEDSVTSVNIPSEIDGVAVVGIGTFAFSYNSNLSSVTMPSSLTYIGNNAFKDCANLTSVSIPSSVAKIENHTFYGCTRLTSITIPTSVTSVGDLAFFGCDSLSKVFYAGTQDEWDRITIGDENRCLTTAYIHCNGTLKLSSDSASIVNGKSILLSVLEDEDSSNYYWRSTDTSIATVASDGRVFGKSVGLTTIKVISKADNSLYAECTVNVVDAVTDLDLWGLSKLVYGEDLMQYVTVGEYIDSRPDLGEYSSMLWNYYEENLADYKILSMSTAEIANKCGFFAVAFEAPSGEIIISYEGSTPTSLGIFNQEFYLDWISTNLVFFLDMYIPQQYKEALEFYDKVNGSGNKEIILTGHSLGGALASFTSLITGARVVTFNGANGAILEDTFYKYPNLITTFNGLSNWDIKAYYNSSDMVGKFNASIYPTLTMTSNNLSEASNHDLESLVTVTDGSIASLSKVSVNNSYKDYVWSRAYNTKSQVYLGNTDLSDKIYDAHSTLLLKYALYSSGGFEFTGNSLRSDVFVAKNGDVLSGKGGNDNYYIHETGNYSLSIKDSAGTDTIYFSQHSHDDLSATRNGDNFTIFSDGGGVVFVDVNRVISINDITVQDKYGEKKSLSLMAYEPSTRSISLTSQEGAFSLAQLTGENITVSILSEDGTVLGTYSSDIEEVSANEFGYAYPMENGLELEVMNSGKHIRIEEGSNISGIFYAVDDDNDTLMQEFTFDLSGHEYAFINTYLDDTDNFYYQDGDVSTAISTIDYVKMTELSSTTTELTMHTGESQSFSVSVAPANTAFGEVEFSWQSLVDSPDTATIIATVTQEDDGTYTIRGTASGSDTLIISSLDGSDLTHTISVTIEQDSAPDVTMTSNGATYTAGWSEYDVSISATKSGYDTFYYTTSGNTTEDSLTVTHDGKTTVSVVAYDSATGKYTANTSVEVWIDSEAPKITGAENNGVYYLPKTVVIRDNNFESATINSAEISIGEYFSGKYVSGTGYYTVTAKDEKGNTTTVSFDIKEFPAATEENADLIAEIRDDFETRYYEFPEATRTQLDSEIRVLEDSLAVAQDPYNSDNDILMFYVSGQLGYSTINPVAKTVTFTLPTEELNQNHVPTLDIPKGASISTNASQAQNFSTGVEYTITAIDTSTSTWTVTAVAPVSDGIEATLEGYTVTNSVIMLELDSYLSSILLSGKDDIKLVHSSDSNIEHSVVSVTASGMALFIEFETSLHDVESGIYTLTIPASSYETVGGTPNSSYSMLVEVTNVMTQIDLTEEEMNTPSLIYTITFDPQSGTISPTSSTTDTTTGKLTSLPTPTRSGYTFNGWYTAESGGTKVSTSTVFTENTTIYAQWTKISSENENTESDTEDNSTEDDSNNSSNGSSSSSSSSSSSTSTSTYTNTLPELDYGTITQNPEKPKSGETVTLTITPANGYEVGEVIVTRIGSNSNVEVTINEDGTFSFKQPSGTVNIEVTFVEIIVEADSALIELPVIHEMTTSTFNDLDNTAWYYDAVKYCYDRGLMSGTGDNDFSPELATSRAMIVQVLYNIAGQPATTGTSFFDVNSDIWYANAVAWASSVGVANGIGDGNFNPNGDMTREQLVVMLYGFNKLMTGESYTESTSLSFTDTNSFNSWGTEATAWAVSNGIVSGNPDGSFAPQGSAKRCEVAQILMNFAEMYS